MAKEVRIELTAAQKAKIKAVTGRTLSEIRVSTLGKNLAVHAKSLRSNATRAEGQSLRSDATRAEGQSLRSDATRAEGQSLRSDATRAEGQSLRSDSFRSGEDV